MNKPFVECDCKLSNFFLLAVFYSQSFHDFSSLKKQHFDTNGHVYKFFVLVHLSISVYVIPINNMYTCDLRRMNMSKTSFLGVEV